MPMAHRTPRQPWLHDLSVCVDGNVTALSDDAGEMDGSGACGMYVDDRRVLSHLQVSLAGEATSPVARSSSGSRSSFVGSARHLGDAGADPTVEVHRRRTVRAMGLEEQIVVASRAGGPVATELLVQVAGDGADVSAVKAGDVRTGLLPVAAVDGELHWADDRHGVRAACDAPGATAAVDCAGLGGFRVPLTVEPGGRCTVTLTVTATRTHPSLFDADPGSRSVDWSAIGARAQDSALEPTLRAGLDDLQHLLLTDPEAPSDVFAGAGTPWYLTLFGRDSLWAARMALPFGTELAAGTLRALARRQGRTVDPTRAEAPGKMPHEVRRAAADGATDGLALPPTYYGTVDATALWICVLHDAWRWGMPVEQVVALLPALRAAVGWLTEHASPDSDGLLKYLDATGTGLSNQGWKDSGDAIRWRDGRVADAPIALIEAQAYAVEAAGCAAALLQAFAEPGADELRAFADRLRTTVRERFWVGHDAPGGPWLGLAVDGAGRTVDGLASNMGHALGTGLLDPSESARVAATLVSDPLLDVYGLRTLAADNGGFNPIGYHTGSIWTHDTAICAWNLARAGHPEQAAVVARTLLASSVAFGHHWPELYSGATALDQPAPYPAACRPQAWAAASAAVLLSVGLGLRPDAPAGRLVVQPCRPSPFGETTVQGLRFAGRSFAVHCSADGSATVDGLAAGVEVEVR